MNKSRTKLLAVASSGGHWTQLQRITPAFGSCDVVYVTVLECYRSDVPNSRLYVVNDATRWNKLALLKLAFQLARILIKEKPAFVISTGAAPGYVALMLGRLFGARTIWVDSITNVDRLSMSGSLAGRCADLWLTQWPHLAGPEGPYFEGSVL